MTGTVSSTRADRRTGRGEVAPPRTGRRRRRLGYPVGGVGAVVAAGWIGLQVQSAPLPPPDLAPAEVSTIAMPDDLPEPVARFCTTLYGDAVPVVDSAVISGRGELRIAGITFPARYRFSHVTGRDYRHYIELTLFGRPLVTVDERYLDGHARLELPFGVSEGANVDQGANLALWAEAVWMPSVWLTDPAVRWEPSDADTARLVVPFGDEEETFTVHFDPDTGLLSRMESMRFKGEQDREKTLWLNHALDWGEVDGHPYRYAPRSRGPTSAHRGRACAPRKCATTSTSGTTSARTGRSTPSLRWHDKETGSSR
ncbi:DUF6544 family protein [Egibacter rhizosphaerae]|uniref:DUF6544 family protein n=1 Tax=Egibacter rhizosphaerae TaxID=1670831 RepID=UPI00197AFE2F|nr:DUF6544 family protein [Egibacter rhizosphaerae]